MSLRSLALGGLALVAFAGTGAAQSAQKFSVQLSALGASLSGENYEGIGTGAGFEAQVRYNHSAFSIGGGYQRTRHSIDEFEDVNGKVNLGGVFVEPRYVIPTRSNSMAPYVSARLSILQEKGTIDLTEDDEIEVSASGLTFNAGGGVLFRLTNTLNLDLGLTWGYTNFGDFTVKHNGVVVPGEGGTDAGSGTNFVFRAGLAIGLGK